MTMLDLPFLVLVWGLLVVAAYSVGGYVASRLARATDRPRADRAGSYLLRGGVLTGALTVLGVVAWLALVETDSPATGPLGTLLFVAAPFYPAAPPVLGGGWYLLDRRADG